jgi:hypothetical protein
MPVYTPRLVVKNNPHHHQLQFQLHSGSRATDASAIQLEHLAIMEHTLKYNSTRQ